MKLWIVVCMTVFLSWGSGGQGMASPSSLAESCVGSSKLCRVVAIAAVPSSGPRLHKDCQNNGGGGGGAGSGGGGSGNGNGSNPNPNPNPSGSGSSVGSVTCSLAFAASAFSAACPSIGATCAGQLQGTQATTTCNAAGETISCSGTLPAQGSTSASPPTCSSPKPNGNPQPQLPSGSGTVNCNLTIASTQVSGSCPSVGATCNGSVSPQGWSLNCSGNGVNVSCAGTVQPPSLTSCKPSASATGSSVASFTDSSLAPPTFPNQPKPAQRGVFTCVRLSEGLAPTQTCGALSK